MVRFWWNVRFAWTMWWELLPGIRFVWYSAKASDDTFADGHTPREALEIEMEHWTW